jgi:hypothetical protein
MASSLTTVGDYISRIKSIANDLDGVRYSAEQYMSTLNMGLLEGYNNRPDFYRDGESSITQYEIGNEGATLNWPKQFAWALITFCSGMLELIDSEGNMDQRAAALITAFQSKLRGKV